MTDDYPVRTTWERRPLEEPPHIIGYTLLFGLITFTGVLTFLFWSVEYKPWQLAAWVAAAVMLVVLMFLLLWKWFASFSETVKETPVTPVDATPLTIRPEYRPSERTIKRGNFAFTEAQWGKLHEALQVHGWKMTRDMARSSGIFDKEAYDKGWGATLREFQRIGFVITGGRQVTEDGKRWIAQFPPPQNGVNGFARPLGRAGESENGAAA